MVLFFMYGPVLMELQKQRGLPCSYLNYNFLNIFINNSLFLAMLPEGPKTNWVTLTSLAHLVFHAHSMKRR